MPLPLAAGLAIGAGAAGLMNSLIGSASNANLNSTNRRWQEQQSTVNYLRQRQLIQDSPSLQKQGLINAGMSPAALGNYSGPSANVSSASGPSGQFSPYVPLDAGQVVDAFLAAKQGEVADSQVHKNEAEANKANEEAGVVAPLAAAQIDKLKASTNLDESSINKIAAEIPVLDNQKDYWKFMSQVENIVADKSKVTFQSEVDALQTQYKLSKAQAEEAMKYVDKLARASYELVTSQVYNNRAQGSAVLSNATTNRLEYEVDSARVALEKIGVDADVALKAKQGLYTDALRSAVPSQKRLNEANASASRAGASASRAAAGRDLEQGKKIKAERKFMPLDYMLKGVDTYSRLLNSTVGATKMAIPFLGM